MTHKLDFKDKKVWITGASSGIGRALCKELAARGAQLAITARNEQALQSLRDEILANRSHLSHASQEESVLCLPFDVTDRQANQTAVQDIRELWGDLDIAFFNAGTAEYIDINRFDAQIFERTMRTNFLSMVYGIEAVLPLLRGRRGTQLGGMSSTVSFGGVPRAEAYGASKAAIRNMLQALRVHLVHQNIEVFTVCPGFVRTPLTDKNDFPMPMRIEVEEAARIIADGIAKRKPEINFPKTFSFLYKLIAALPSALYTRLLLSTVRKA
ncbi:MAG: SDR family NAD(P)-dependent oxidoreductase [Gammaproteobacteria bacterium]|jgi:NAD(P)-dependent dehydrogenase (short-subunit alcohol dehydrogenase family)